MFLLCFYFYCAFSLQKKKKLDEKELADRHNMLRVAGEEIQELTKANSRVQAPVSEEEALIQQRREKRSIFFSFDYTFLFLLHFH